MSRRADYTEARRRAAASSYSGSRPATEAQLEHVRGLLDGLGKGPLRNPPKTHGEASRLIELLRRKTASVRRPA